MDVLPEKTSDPLIESIQTFSWNKIKKHPVGNVFTILAGEDASAMFYSNHLE